MLSPKASYSLCKETLMNWGTPTISGERRLCRISESQLASQCAPNDQTYFVCYILHIHFLRYKWEKRLRYDRGPFVRFGDIVSNESRSVFTSFTHARSKTPDQECERASWYKTQHEKMFFWKLLKGAALQRCAAVLKESEVIIWGIIFPNNRIYLYCKTCIWSGFISTADVKKLHSSLSLYHPSIIRALRIPGSPKSSEFISAITRHSDATSYCCWQTLDEGDLWVWLWNSIYHACKNNGLHSWFYAHCRQTLNPSSMIRHIWAN